MKLSRISNHASQNEGLEPGLGSDNELDPAEREGGNASEVQGLKSEMSSSLRCQLIPPQTLELTMFERLEKLHGPGVKCMLTVQYRCVIGLWQSGPLSQLS
jgi:DNA polymerase alpha-associated DNA helicase A